VSTWIGYWPALFVAPPLVGAVGARVERYGLRRVHEWGHVPELLCSFGLSFIVVERVQIVWSRAAVPYRVPESLQRPRFTLFTTSFPTYRGFMMLVAVLMPIAIWRLLTRTRFGLVIQASLTHPGTVEALGHTVPRVFMRTFAGGWALAGPAGVIGGNAFVTEPSMAALVGSIICAVVAVGGMGSLAGAFVASLLIGTMQTFAIVIDSSGLTLLEDIGVGVADPSPLHALLRVTVAQVTPILPDLLRVRVLIFRPKGLMGVRERGARVNPAAAQGREIGCESIDVGRGFVWSATELLSGVPPTVFTSGFGITLLPQMGIPIVFALSYIMIFGPGGMLSFGHAVCSRLRAFFAIHAMNWISAGTLPLPISMLPLVGGVFGALFGVLSGSVTTKKSGTPFAMITLGMGGRVFAASLMFPGFFGGEGAFRGTGWSANRSSGSPTGRPSRLTA
jgi:branched-chain amino acid transport system permease protein